MTRGWPGHEPGCCCEVCDPRPTQEEKYKKLETKFHEVRDYGLKLETEIERLEARAQKAEIHELELRQIHKEDRARIAVLTEALGFFMCCVRAGEPWTERCEEMRAKALGK